MTGQLVAAAFRTTAGSVKEREKATQRDGILLLAVIISCRSPGRPLFAGSAHLGLGEIRRPICSAKRRSRTGPTHTIGAPCWLYKVAFIVILQVLGKRDDG